MTKKTILDEIIQQKFVEVVQNKNLVSQVELEDQAKKRSDKRDFVGSIRDKIQCGKPAIIAEIKKASPSKGLIRLDFDPELIAADYEKSGATCLSVLTDQQYFQGSDVYLQQARAVCQLPIIRKDFMVDAYQIVESKAMGADCVLLIVAALQKSQLDDLACYAREIGIDVLVEIHNDEELDIVLDLDGGSELKFPLIGINNRNLHTFQTDLGTTYQLSKKIPSDRLIVTESGIENSEQIKEMLERGIFGFLIGETFMRAESPGAKLRELFVHGS